MQGKLVLKDFNIAEAAGGPGKPIIKNFTVSVTSHTLKIHLYWAGRGTTGIPFRGTYGPLISAISVDPSMLSTLMSTASTKGTQLEDVDLLFCCRLQTPGSSQKDQFNFVGWNNCWKCLPSSFGSRLLAQERLFRRQIHYR